VSFYVSASDSPVVTLAESQEDVEAHVCFRANGVEACYQKMDVCKLACQSHVQRKLLLLEQEKVINGPS